MHFCVGASGVVEAIGAFVRPQTKSWGCWVVQMAVSMAAKWGVVLRVHVHVYNQKVIVETFNCNSFSNLAK